MIPDIDLKVDPKSNMVICSLANGDHQALLDIMWPTVEQYGKNHGIDSISFKDTSFTDRPAAWNKVILLKNLLKYYKIVMWMDADAIFVNPKPDIRKEIKKDTIMLLCTHEFLEPCRPNTGVWIVKRNPKSFELLEEIWNQTDWIPNPTWEQAALCRLLGCSNPLDLRSWQGPTKYTSYIQTLDIKWNSMMVGDGFLGVSDDPVIEHYLGMALYERMYAMQSSYKKFMERNQSKWTLFKGYFKKRN